MNRADRLAANFAPDPAPLTTGAALAEASRCLFCFDAPCVRSCPTGIDIPRFIRQIGQANPAGAARTILDANIFGGSCARACPTEILCEGACVELALGQPAIAIGRLQRFATDHPATRAGRPAFFGAGPGTGRTVAVVGSGPAGLSCAHELRRLGHAVVVFEAQGHLGGLDATGIAAYKVTFAEAQAEIDDLLAIGGIEVRLNTPIAPDALPGLLAEYDAVFLGVGLGRTAAPGIPGEDLPGVREALDFIAETHLRPYEAVDVGRRVVVLGGGNTAIDVATAARRLGAEVATIAYRRGPGELPAFPSEVALARRDGVEFLWHVAAVEVVAAHGRAAGVRFVRVEPAPGLGRGGPVRPIAGSEFVLEADRVVMALGQVPLALLDALPGLIHDGGRVAVDPATRSTSVPGLFAGGDCLRNGGEVVDAVQDGKLAARGIDAALGGRHA